MFVISATIVAAMLGLAPQLRTLPSLGASAPGDPPDGGNVARLAAVAPGATRSSAEPQATTDPVIAAAGDIACDPAHSSFNGGTGTANSCRQKYTSDLVYNQGLAAVLALGDNQYYCASYDAFLKSYEPSWGRVKSITYPVVGNHEYLTYGGTEPSTGCNSTNDGAAGHFKYFGARAGDPSKGYYSFNIGSWHIIALNSNCSKAGGCSSSTPQGQWLRNDLAAHSNYCTLAFWHTPLFSSGGRDDATFKTFWDALYQYGADVVLNGHDHIYERFAPQRPDGTRDDSYGIREFISGAGGANHTSLVTTAKNSQIRNADTYGVLKLTLRATGYDWKFVPEAGKTFTDSGTGSCHGVPDMTPPSAPGNLKAQAVGGTRVDLGWTASTDNVGVTGYRIFRNSTQIATTTRTTYSDTTVQPDTSYSYHVTAYDAAGNVSGSSNTATVATGPADTALTFTPTADTYVQSDASGTNYGSATSFTADSSPIKDSLLKFSVSGVGTGKVTSVKLKLRCVDSGGMGGSFHRVASTSWGETTVTYGTAPAHDSTALASLGGVSSGTWYTVDVTPLVTGDGTYSLKIRSTSSDGSGYSSKEGTAGYAPQLVVTVGSGTTTDSIAPTAPLNLTATAVSSSQVNLSWVASVDLFGVSGYRIYRNGAQVATTTGTSYSDTGLSASTTYSYYVTAFDAAGNVSDPSNTATVTTPGEAPRTLTFTPTADTYVQSDASGTNYGSATSFTADSSPIKDSLLKFSVSGVGTGKVTSVKLKLRCVDSGGMGGSFHRVASTSWGETTVTYGTAPAHDSTALASLGGVSSGTWYTVDVTPLVTGDGTYSLKIRSTSSDGSGYSSKEGTAGYAPQLVVTVQ